MARPDVDLRGHPSPRHRQITSQLPRLPRPGLRGDLVRGFQARRVVANYLRDDGDGLATIIAFNALFSLLPFLLVVFSILSLFAKSERVNRQIQSWVNSLLPGSGGNVIIDVVQQGRENLGQVSLIALVSLLIGGSRLFAALDNAFARIYRVERRPYLVRKLAALVMVPVFSLLMIAAATASTMGTVMLAVPERVFDSSSTPWLSAAFTLTLSFIAAYLMAFVVYSTIPNYHAGPRRQVSWPGSLVAASMFVGLSQLFPLYLRLTGGFGVFGGVFALALVLMLWLYLLGQIIVIGAEVNALAGGRRDIPSVMVEDTDAL